MRQWKKVGLAAVLLAVAGLLAYSARELWRENAAGTEQLGLDLSAGTVVAERDTHGGFHGDGERKIAVDCSDIRDEVLAQTASWSSLPLPGVLAQAAELSGSGLIPDGLTHGRYLFLDRHSEAADPRDPGPLFHRASFNFTLAVYDAASDILYYYELDT